MLTDFVDNYCERTGPGLWAEPLNFLSNAMFFLAALVIYREMSSLPHEKRRPLLIAVGLLVLTGIGSSLFHSFATRWAEVADVIPIGIFLIYYLWMFLSVLWGADRALIVKGFLGFGAATSFFALTLTQPVFNHSQTYFGTLVALVAMGYATWVRRLRRVSLYYWGAGGLFLGALVCRSIDLQICPLWPLGTHFLWHAFNGGVTYLVLKGALVWLNAPEAKIKENSQSAIASASRSRRQ